MSDRQTAGLQTAGRLTLFFYALPAAPLAALGLPLYALIPTYYTETVGLPVAAVGWCLLLVRVFDALTDPVTGYLADRIRPGFGRRRTLFTLSLPLAAVSALMLYWPPEGATIWWLALWGSVLSLAYTLATVPYTAWGAELVSDYHGRTRLAAFRESLTLAGTLIAIILPFAIGFEASGLSGLAVLGISVAIALPLFGVLAIVRVPEPRDASRSRLTLRQGLHFLGQNRPFLRLIAAFFLNGFANGIPATLFLYFVSDRLQLPDMRGPLFFLYFLCGIGGIPLAALVSHRIGKHRAWCYAMLATCLIFSAAPLLQPGALFAFAAICVATGLLLGFDLAIPPSMQADVIDADTAASGEQRGGIYFAAWGLATKLSLAAGVGLVFPLLSFFGFDPADAGGNSQTALFALAVIYCWIPIVLKCAAVSLMWNFPIDRIAQEGLRARISG